MAASERSAQTIDVAAFIDSRRPGRFQISVLILGFLLVLADGYDIAAIAFAAPGMIARFGVTSMAAMGPVLSASLVGILFGALIFGWIGDRFGRKSAIIASSLLFGAITWITADATSLEQVLVLRLVAGVGIGGLLPTVGALAAEMAPRRWRASMMIILYSGVAFGGGFPGLVAATLVPEMGWPVIFRIGGIVPVLTGIACIWMMPESVRFLVLKRRAGAAVAAILSRIAGEAIDPGARFVVAEEADLGRFSPAQLFAGRLAPITPLLWLCFMLNLMGYFFLLSWTPTVLAAAHMPPARAAVAGMLTQFGGLVGGLLLARPMDRHGLLPLAPMFGLAIPVIAAIGWAAGAQAVWAVFGLQFFAGFCVLGGQTGLNVGAALIYPTAIRANGSGWAFGVGRLGSIVGPMLGGVLIARHLSVQSLYLVASLPYLVAFVAALAMGQLYRRRFHAGAIEQRAPVRVG